MTDKRFRVGIDKNNGVGLFDGSIRLLFIKFSNKEDALSCENALMYQCNLMNELNNENEQLKQFKDKVFNLISMRIKHYEHKPISAPVGQPMSVNFDHDVDRLARLSELEQLEKELES